MKKGLRTLCIIFLMAAISSGYLTGCRQYKDIREAGMNNQFLPGKGQERTASLPEVRLKYYHVGNPSAGWEDVLAATNRKLKGKINATVDVAFITPNELDKRYPLITASGEDYDWIFTSSWCYFSQEGNKGAFYALNELLPEYAPKIWGDCPGNVWDGARLNGKIYMIPSYLTNIASFHGIFYREDLRKKYNIPEIRHITDFEAYFEAIKKNEPDMIPLNIPGNEAGHLYFLYQTDSTVNMFVQDGINASQLSYVLGDPKPEVVHTAFDKTYEEWAVTAKRWADKGFWSMNALSNKKTSQASFDEGISAAGLFNCWKFNESYIAAREKHPDWEVGFYYPMPQSGKKFRGGFCDGVAVGVKSKKPGRTLMAIELLVYDEDVFNVANYGVEGINYINKNGIFIKPPGRKPGETFVFSSVFEMGMHHDVWRKDDKSLNSPLFNDKLTDMDYYLSVTEEQILINMKLKTDDIKDELAVMNDIKAIYDPVIQLGLTNDAGKTLQEYRDKLKAAGVEKVRAEVQKQVDAYLETK